MTKLISDIGWFLISVAMSYFIIFDPVWKLPKNPTLSLFLLRGLTYVLWIGLAIYYGFRVLEHL